MHWKVSKVEICCSRMSARFLEENRVIIFNDEVRMKMENSPLPINFCPFCGQEIEFMEET